MSNLPTSITFLLWLVWPCAPSSVTGFFIRKSALPSLGNLKEQRVPLIFTQQPRQVGERYQASWYALFTRTRISLASTRVGLPKTEIRLHKCSTLDPWLEKVVELHGYQERWGDTLVPKRYDENPQLANWCSKQRQQYRKLLASETPCSMTSDRIETLNRIGFVWNATGVHSNFASKKSKSQTQNHDAETDEQWWSECTKVQSIVTEIINAKRDSNGDYIDEASQLKVSEETFRMMALSDIPAKSDSGKFLAVQRKEHFLWSSGKPCTFDNEKHKALSSLDKHWWMAHRERSWHIRYGTLVAYKQQYGDTLCKISFRSKGLAHWCSNQRKSYNLKMVGEKTTLTDERQVKLEEIGMVWNRWDFEFDQKCVE